MSGENAVATPATQNPAQGSSATPSQSAPPSEELSRLQEINARQAASINGYKPFGERLGKYGITKPEELDQWEPLFKESRERKLSPAAMRALLAEHIGAQQAQEQPQTNSFDPSKIEEMVSKAVSERMRKAAEREHERMEQEELDEIEAMAAEFDKDDEYERDRTKAQLILDSLRARQKYGDDHDLKGQYRPLNKAERDALRKTFSERRTKAEGDRLARAAANAAAQKDKPASTPAGKSAQQGKPEGSGDAGRLMSRRERKESEDNSLRSFMAARGGATAG